MKQNALVVLLALTVLALGAVVVVQQRTIRRLNRAAPPSALTVAAPTRPAPAAGRTPAAPAAVPEAPAPAPAVAPTPGTAGSPAAAPPAVAAGTSPTNAPAGMNLAAVIKNPGMRDMIRAQQKATLDVTYGTLFRSFDLDDDALTQLKELLLERQMAIMDLSLDVMNGSLTPEERRRQSERLTEVMTAYDERLKELLGDENFGIYRQYEDTQPERMQVTLFKRTLPPDGQITEAQEHDLIMAMHEERTNFSFSVPLDRPEGMSMTSLSEDVVDRYMEELSRLQVRYTTRALGLLSSNQLTHFKITQEQQRAMQQMGLKVAAQMFSGPPASPDAADADQD